MTMMVSRSSDPAPRAPINHLLKIALRFNPAASSFLKYIANLNKILHRPIVLSTATDPPNYTSLLQKLYIFPPSPPPKNIHETFQTPIPIDQVLADVITTLLRSHQPFVAHSQNVLTAGLFLAREEGAASILRDIDARSPSAPLQHLRSPSWRLLYRRIGHGLMRHLLLNSTLLLAVSRPVGPSVFLQLCGPVATLNDYPHTRRLGRSASNIILRRDVLYHQLSRPRQTVANHGLPAANHLHRLKVTDAPLLLLLIFPTLWHPNKHPKEVRRYDTLVATIQKAKPVRRHKIKRLRSFIPILRHVLVRIRQRSFRRLLGTHCPLQYPPNATTPDIIRMHTPTKRVAVFLVACTRQILPPEFLGSSRNRFIFEYAVHRFVRNRLRNESFDIHRFFSERGLSIVDIPWLGLQSGSRVVNPTDLRFRKERLQDVMVWLFRGILIPLLQQNFYATEGTLNRNRIFFFRNEVWERLVDPARSAPFCSGDTFLPLSKEQFALCISRREAVLNRLTTTGLGSRLGPYQVLYYHHMRQMPKKSAMRGIQRPRVKLLYELRGSRQRLPISKSSPRRASMKLTLNMARSITRSLMNSILKVLIAESKSQTGRLGVSVFNLQDIYAHFISFKQSWLRRGRPAMYVCCVDITKSFDTIPLQTLFTEVVPALFSKDRYVLLRYRLSQPDVSTRFVKHRYAAHVCSNPGDETSFVRLLRETLSPTHAGAIFSDLAMVTTMTTKDVVAAMEEFLTNNLVSYRAKKRKRSESGFALQSRGLPQGHQLSPLLTALFYSHVEKQDLEPFLPSASSNSNDMCSVTSRDTKRNVAGAEQTNLFLRFIDDTVFLTSSKEQAMEFLRRMAKGWKASHGFSINVEKTRTNFAAGQQASSDCLFTLMPWCGLLIDTRNMEIRVDYKRYKPDGGRLRDFIVVEHDLQPGRVFAERALFCFNPKIHALLLDSRINSLRTVSINLYQAAVLSCLKLCSYVMEVRLKRPFFLISLVEKSVSNFVNLTSRSVSNHAARELSCRFQFSTSEVRYLCAHAYCAALEKKLGHGKEGRAAMTACTKRLRTAVNQIATSLRSRKDICVLHAAEYISKHECHDLWTIPL